MEYRQERGLVVVFDHNPFDDLFFYAFLRGRFQLRKAINRCTALSPLCHGGGVFIFKAPGYPNALQHGTVNLRSELRVIVRKAEIKDAETFISPLVLGRLDDPRVKACLDKGTMYQKNF